MPDLGCAYTKFILPQGTPERTETMRTLKCCFTSSLLLLLTGCSNGGKSSDDGRSSDDGDPDVGSLNLLYYNAFDQYNRGGAETPETVPLRFVGSLNGTSDGQGVATFDLTTNFTGITTNPWHSSGGFATNLAPGDWTVSLTVNGSPIGTCGANVQHDTTVTLKFMTTADNTFGGCTISQ
jgi:hypothetical protein